jgi:DNA-binding response OmpR family regulator
MVGKLDGLEGDDMTHVLIVEDDPNTLALIEKYFSNEGFQVKGYSEAQGVLDYIRNNRIDLCVLDVMIGHDNGFDLLKEIKAIKDIPVIFVTAKADEFDRIYGIEIGADDYLTKPFSPRELVARAIRLLGRLNKDLGVPDTSVLRAGRITVNTDTMDVRDLEIKINLTLKEYELLVYMMHNPKHVLSRDMLVERVWGYDALGQTRMVDDIVKRLRKKLSINIETVWGVGYKLNE